MRKYRTVWMMVLQWGGLWSLVICCSLLWNQHLTREHSIRHAHEEASTVLNKDLAFRRWATMHGGVYVHPTAQTPPNPWLHVPKRDLLTTDGERLTLMNPAYMTRQIMTMFGDQFGIKGHITSLYLKNPNNAPDDWERQALLRFEKGETEIVRNDGQHYRLIRIMKMEQGCLKCHADTKIPVGGVRGGVSVIVPLTPHLQEALRTIAGIRLAHSGIWLAGMFGIAVAGVRSWRQQQRERRAEENLRAQEALYASLATASPTGIFQSDPTGRYCYVNDRWCGLTGLRFDQALGDGWIASLYPEDRQQVVDEWQRSVEERRHFSRELRLCLPDGQVNWVYAQSALIYDTAGTVTGYVGTITDITDRKLAEQGLREATLFLNESQAIAHVGGWKSNPATDMLYWTEAMYRMFEHPRGQEISHAACFRYFDPQDLPQAQQALLEAQQNGTPFRLNCRMVTASGRRFWVDFRCVGRVDGPEGPYLAGIMQDITEHKQIEELLTNAKETAEAVSRTKTELMGILSHELRTPLNGVLGGVQLLEMTELDEEQQEYLGMVRLSATNELALVNDLLDLAGLEASGVRLEVAPFGLLDSIRMAVFLHRAAVEEQGLTLQVELSDSLNRQVVGDCRRLTQIVNNLLNNAVKFTRQGVVTVAADLRPGAGTEVRLQLCVSDTGIGIDPADLKRIFDPFVQADMSSTRKFGGTGLGLAICRRLAERMGGSIRVESRAGEGSRFTLELPLQSADRPVQEPAGICPVLPVWHNRRLTALIAEDNAINRKAAVSLMERLGFLTLGADDGKKALALWMQGGVDVILMDIQMPVMSGLEATRCIRRQEQGSTRHTPVIALTAHAMAGDRQRLLQEGFDGYVAKPFQLQELAAELERVIGPDAGGLP